VPDYLAPGVYVEEVSFRSRSIPGVPTSAGGVLALGVLIGVGLAVLVDQVLRRRCRQAAG
jgi:hypothetical protein